MPRRIEIRLTHPERNHVLTLRHDIEKSADPALGKRGHVFCDERGAEGRTHCFALMRGDGVWLYTRENAGIESISHTLPPISESCPITVSPPRIVAPA